MFFEIDIGIEIDLLLSIGYGLPIRAIASADESTARMTIVRSTRGTRSLDGWGYMSRQWKCQSREKEKAAATRTRRAGQGS